MNTSYSYGTGVQTIEVTDTAEQIFISMGSIAADFSNVTFDMTYMDSMGNIVNMETVSCNDGTGKCVVSENMLVVYIDSNVVSEGVVQVQVSTCIIVPEETFVNTAFCADMEGECAEMVEPEVQCVEESPVEAIIIS